MQTNSTALPTCFQILCKQIAFTLFLFILFNHPASAQHKFGVEIGFTSLSLASTGASVEYVAVRNEPGSFLKSIRLSTGYGNGITNAQYIPLETRLVFLDGLVDVITGVAIQVKWNPYSSSETRHFVKSSAINPVLGLALRYEPQEGGWMFRCGYGAMFITTQSKFFGQAIFSLGMTL